MIRQDSITKAFTIISLLIPFYLATFEMGLDALFPALFLLTGLTLTWYANHVVEDVGISETETKQIGLNTVYAFVGISIAGIVPAWPLNISLVGKALYGMLYAVAEEHVFRGGILNFLLTKFPPIFAILGSAASFMVYHLSIGTSTEFLMFVFGSGAVLAWVAERTQRLSPCILAHVLWNVVRAWMG